MAFLASLLPTLAQAAIGLIPSILGSVLGKGAGAGLYAGGTQADWQDFLRDSRKALAANNIKLPAKELKELAGLAWHEYKKGKIPKKYKPALQQAAAMYKKSRTPVRLPAAELGRAKLPRLPPMPDLPDEYIDEVINSYVPQGSGRARKPVKRVLPKRKAGVMAGVSAGRMPIKGRISYYDELARFRAQHPHLSYNEARRAFEAPYARLKASMGL